MATHPNTMQFERKSAENVRRALDTFEMNNTHPLMAGSVDFFRQAHGLLGFITCAMTLAENIDAINGTLRQEALESVETLMSMGLFLADAERIMGRAA